MPRPVLVLVLALSAALLALVAAATAPFHSPSLAGGYMCPEDSSVRVRQYHASWNEPGETGISIACVDARGVVQESADQEARGFWILWSLYFILAFVGLLVVAGLTAAVRRRLMPPVSSVG